MHMADALVSPAVAVTMYAASAAAAGVSLVQLHKEETAAPELAKKKLPTMAVMSALVFAGQMINYTIPGTGSSGHLCGGMLLSAILGPWAGFLSMIVILRHPGAVLRRRRSAGAGGERVEYGVLRLLRGLFPHLPAAHAGQAPLR